MCTLRFKPCAAKHNQQKLFVCATNLIYRWTADDTELSGFLLTGLLLFIVFSDSHLLHENCLTPIFLSLLSMVMMGWFTWIHPVTEANRVIINTDVTVSYYISHPADRWSENESASSTSLQHNRAFIWNLLLRPTVCTRQKQDNHLADKQILEKGLSPDCD